MNHPLLQKEAPIGVFDSGLGGISVLKELRRLMPCENYLFFGDRKNAPYGNRTEEEVLALTRAAVDFFKKEGCKAVVLACNTATGAAADILRKEYPEFSIIGVEPAVKPAVEENQGKTVLLMATPLAVKTERIKNLSARFKNEANILFLPCPGLVELIEQGHLDTPLLYEYLKGLFPSEKPDAVVLGCTHYPHIAATIRKVLGENVRLYDGGIGTAKRTRSLLTEKNLLTQRKEKGNVRFVFSAEDENTLSLAKSLLESE